MRVIRAPAGKPRSRPLRGVLLRQSSSQRRGHPPAEGKIRALGDDRRTNRRSRGGANPARSDRCAGRSLRAYGAQSPHHVRAQAGTGSGHLAWLPQHHRHDGDRLSRDGSCGGPRGARRSIAHGNAGPAEPVLSLFPAAGRRAAGHSVAGASQRPCHIRLVQQPDQADRRRRWRLVGNPAGKSRLAPVPEGASAGR